MTQEVDAMRAQKRVVVVGGGHGASRSIECLLDAGFAVDAVVAMADDGGSSGLLRQLNGSVPPGDVRNCLVAFAADRNSLLARAIQHRFSYLDDHALGNLLLTALAEEAQSFEAAIEACQQLLGARGNVIPSTFDPVTFWGETLEGQRVKGQRACCKSATPLRKAWITTAEEGGVIAPNPRAEDALKKADYVVLGPGSLFTSTISSLLVPGMVDALCQSNAKVLFVSSLCDEQGETRGFTVDDQVKALEDLGLRGRIGAVLAQEEDPLGETFGVLARTAETRERLEQRGIRVVSGNFVDPENPGHHKASALSAAFAEVLG